MKNNSAADGGPAGNGKLSAPSAVHTTAVTWRMARTSVVFVGVILGLLVLYNSTINPFKFLPVSDTYRAFRFSAPHKDPLLEKVLKEAAMEDGTIILTTLNDAWAEPDSLLDLFLKSFHIGNGTQRLLKHLVIVTLDEKAYSRCVALHPHCYELNTQGTNFSSEAYFMTPDYLKMMWRRIEFLTSVLQMGYSFVFTDSDIMWLQDPFNHFYPDADFQIACDFFMGNSEDLNNNPNGGFVYVKANPKTVKFYKFWYESRTIYPGKHDQDVLNKIKHSPLISKIGLKLRFLDTANFGGFCQMGRDMNKMATVHANCCVGLENKVHDLRILLQDWSNFFNPTTADNKLASSTPSWTVPQDCRTSFQRGRQRKDNKNTGDRRLL
ncbi:uncharacterized protein At4g15970-like [Benincasa hispida]|uniref:uncharacterized protein At4g15970-like n=1 Tax=Benincasa hispida TaxID=102211 RepID=UPI001900E675|nr:uncharacterized protein At4g15970-like [Benincasa hispida]